MNYILFSTLDEEGEEQNLNRRQMLSLKLHIDDVRRAVNRVHNFVSGKQFVYANNHSFVPLTFL